MDYHLNSLVFNMGEAKRRKDLGLPPREKEFVLPEFDKDKICLLYTSPSPRDRTRSRMPSSA